MILNCEHFFSYLLPASWPRGFSLQVYAERVIITIFKYIFTFNLLLWNYSLILKPSSNPLQMHWSGDFDHEKCLQEPAYGFEISYRKPPPREMYIYEDFPFVQWAWTLENIDQWQRWIWNTEIIMLHPEQSLELVIVFIAASRLYVYTFETYCGNHLSKCYLVILSIIPCTVHCTVQGKFWGIGQAVIRLGHYAYYIWS